MIDFAPTEDQRTMTREVAHFATSVLLPALRATERGRELSEDVRAVAHALGLSSILAPESAGGAGLGMTTAVLVDEALASGDPAAPFAIAGPGAFGLAVAEFASDEQAKRLLAPFFADDGFRRFGAVAWGEKKARPDRPGLSTRARRDGTGFVLDGRKDYVVNADRADVFVVFAETDDAKGFAGVRAFVVPRGAAGLTTGPRASSVGLDAVSFGSVTLEGVRVEESEVLAAAGPPGSGDVPAALVRFFAKHGVLVAARAVGLMQAAFDVTRDFCETRKAFGKPIGHFQAVAFTLADRAMDVEASRALVHRAAAAWDAPDASPATRLRHSARAIAFVQRAVMRAGDDAVQLHGGAGFIRDYAVEKYMRDAKQIQVTGLGRGHAEQLLAALELDVPVDPTLVLPYADNQNVFV
ncbi:MAG: acyl-CoA dehydrogenase family protein [Polyangiaceae bacterium]